jgi:3-oxoacyl-[acyl-carrier-protein] synthase-1
MAAPHPKPVAVVGRGLVCSLAHDVITACAAARAGITRPSEFAPYPVSSPDAAQGEPLTVHAVPSLTRGFQGALRMARLLEGALRDLRTQVPDAPWGNARVGVFVSLPDPKRVFSGGPLLGDDEQRKDLEQRAGAQSFPAALDVAHDLLARAFDLAEWQERPRLMFCAQSGSPGTAEAVARAMEALSADAVDQALVIAADSFLDAATLSWLDRTARLKTPMRATGLMPGEACGCLLLENSRRARARGVQPLGFAHMPTLGQEPDYVLEGRYARGHALARTIAAEAAKAGWAEGALPWLISDHDGEEYRAMEWGNAWMHLAAQLPPCRELRTWTPAESFGSTGAASGVIAACVALAAFARGYAPWSSAVLVNASDGPVRSAWTLSQEL